MIAFVKNEQRLSWLFSVFIFVFLTTPPALAQNSPAAGPQPKHAKKIAVKKEPSEPSQGAEILERRAILDSLNEFHQSWEVLDLFSGEAHKNAGDYLFATQSFDEAEKEFRQALKMEYQDSSLYLHLGMLRMRKNDLQVALENFRAAVNLKPDSPTIHNHLGELYARQKKYGLAEKEFNRAVELDPKDELALMNLGNLFYYFRKNYPDAKTAYSRVLEINPNLNEAKGNLKIILADQTKAAVAEKEFGEDNALDHDFLRDKAGETPHFFNF